MTQRKGPTQVGTLGQGDEQLTTDHLSPNAPGEPVEVLEAQIKKCNRQVVESANRTLEHARRAGELLLELKQRLPHGQFTSRVRVQCGISPRTARVYMQIAKGLPAIQSKTAGSAVLSIAEALKLIADSKDSECVSSDHNTTSTTLPFWDEVQSLLAEIENGQSDCMDASFLEEIRALDAGGGLLQVSRDDIVCMTLVARHEAGYTVYRELSDRIVCARLHNDAGWVAWALDITDPDDDCLPFVLPFAVCDDVSDVLKECNRVWGRWERYLHVAENAA